MFYKTHRFEGIEPGCGGDMTMGVITGGAFDVVPSSSALGIVCSDISIVSPL